MQDSDGSIISRKVVFTGEFTIHRGAELKQMVESAIEQADSVVINLLNVTEIDLAGIQLLCAARHAAVVAGKQLGLAGEIPKGLKGTLALAGLPAGENCARDCGKSCLWDDLR